MGLPAPRLPSQYGSPSASYLPRRSQRSRVRPFKSQTTLPDATVSSPISFCVPSIRAPNESTNANLPSSIPSTATVEALEQHQSDLLLYIAVLLDSRCRDFLERTRTRFGIFPLFFGSRTARCDAQRHQARMVRIPDGEIVLTLLAPASEREA
jgi:hypothetical protein